MAYIPLSQRQEKPKAIGYVPVAKRVAEKPTEPIISPEPRATGFDVGGISTPEGEVGGMTLDPTQIPKSGDVSLEVRPLKKVAEPAPTREPQFFQGRQFFTLPDNLGGGSYFKDFIDVPRKDKKINYGGVKTQEDMERDHILSLFLDTPDIAENIKIRQSGNLIERFLDIPVGKIPAERRQQITADVNSGKVAAEWRIYQEFQKTDKTPSDRAEAITALKRFEFEQELKQTELQKWGNAFKDIAKTLFAPLEFIHKTGQQVTNAFSFVTNMAALAVTKRTGGLESLSYDQLWADELEAFTDRVITIGAPLQPILNLWTGKRQEADSVFKEEYSELAVKANVEFEKGNLLGGLKESGKMFFVKFSEDWSNPFFLFSIKGISAGSFKLQPKERIIFQTQLNPIKADFLLGTKVKAVEKTLVYNINTKVTKPYIDITSKGKVKVQKPEVKLYVKQNKNGLIDVKVTNSGGEIMNKNLVSKVIEEPKLIGTGVVKPPTTITPAVKGVEAVVKPIAQVTKVVKPTTPPTKVEEKPLIKKVPREQLPVKPLSPDAKIKVSKLEARVKGALKAVDEAKIDKLGLSTFQEMNKVEQIREASKFVTQEPEKAMDVLLGKEQAPKGLLRNSIFIAMQESANVNKDLALKLASLESTRLGQEISILTELDEFSAAGAVDRLVKIHEKSLEKRTGRKASELKSSQVENIKKRIKVNAPKKDAWDKFILEIKC